MPRKLSRAALPVNRGLGLGKLRRVAHTLGWLRQRAGAASFDPRQRFKQQLRTQLGEFALQVRRCGVHPDRNGTLRKYRPGIESGFELHYGHARLRIACKDGPLDRCGATPARQQRGVNVQAPACGDCEHGRRQ